MHSVRTSVSGALAAAVCVTLCVIVRADQDTLRHAEDLYRAAAYDEALSVLSSMPSAGSNRIEVAEYRIFCLLALDRTEEARAAIAALVDTAPFYQLSETQASPRVRAFFTEVRQAVLPSVVHDAYANAKAAFDRKDPHATAAFDDVLKLLQDPDLAGNAEFKDLATVVGAFRDLSMARDAPPPAPISPPTAPATATTADDSRAPQVEPKSATVVPVYREGEPNLAPPVALAQPMPDATLSGDRLWTGALELVIDETGQVVSARMVMPITAAYDRLLLQAASHWKYRPAQQNGVPVRYVKVINIRVDARRGCSGGGTARCSPDDK